MREDRRERRARREHGDPVTGASAFGIAHVPRLVEGGLPGAGYGCPMIVATSITRGQLMSDTPEAPEVPPDPEAAPVPSRPKRARIRSTRGARGARDLGGKRSPSSVLLAVLAAVLVLALAVLVPVVVRRVRQSQDPPLRPTSTRSEVFEGLRNDHTDGDVDYPTSPPVGGPHDPAWLDCGVYDAPVRNENAVHDLEHGTVWISYRPGLDAADVAALARAAARQRHPRAVRRPAGAGRGHRLGRPAAADGADDPRLALFLAGFSDGHTAPEPFASCAGGIDEADADEGSHCGLTGAAPLPSGSGGWRGRRSWVSVSSKPTER